jgi:pimeloyl-ACP methyl ester carboxylesterase
VGIDGFSYREIEVGATRYRPGVAGDGAPVLLLHGFPQTHCVSRPRALGRGGGCDIGRAAGDLAALGR